MSSAETDYSAAKAAGVITSLDGVRRSLSPIETQRAQIDVEAKGRKVWSLGDVKVAMPETATRRLGVALSEAEGALHWQMDVQDVRLGELAVKTDGQTASIIWTRGPLADLKPKLDRLQELLLEFPVEEALSQVFETVVDVGDANGEVYAVPLANHEDGDDETNEQWLVLSTTPPAADALSFRLAIPQAAGDLEAGLTWIYATITDTPPASAD